jgi:hypothetical protein
MTGRVTLLVVAVVFSGCGANARYAADCAWPSHEERRLVLQRPADARHLADDAQTAEDIAIRHADHTVGTAGRDVMSYRDTREACKAALFARVGSRHGVSADDVAQAVGRRRVWLDVMVGLAFAAIYVVVAHYVAGRLFRGALADSVVLATGMAMVTSVALAGVGVLAGDVWSMLIESIRVGNGHMSYRVSRVPWRNHPWPIFVMGAALFLVVAAIRWERQSKTA